MEPRHPMEPSVIVALLTGWHRGDSSGTAVLEADRMIERFPRFFVSLLSTRTHGGRNNRSMVRRKSLTTS
jgi:hypothetical protein